MDKKIYSVLLFIVSFLFIFLTTIFSTFAWYGSGYHSNITASVVKYYFDVQSGDGTSASSPFIITKPIHLCNLSYLQNKGYFDNNTFYFQLGKQIDGTGSYYFYLSNTDSETSTTNLSSTTLDMNNLQQGYDFEPIGFVSQVTASLTSTDHPFIGHFIGNNLVIKNLKVHVENSTTKYAGMFGVIGDGANISSFDLQNEVIYSTGSSQSSSTLTAGLVIGYMNSSTTTSISLESIGCSGCEYQGSRAAESSYTFIGSGSENARSYLDEFYSGGSSDTGDTGYIDFDVFTSGGTISNTIDKNTSGYEYFGVFSFTGGSTGDGIYAYDYFSSRYPRYQPFFESSRIYIGGTNVNADNSLKTSITIGSSDGSTVPTYVDVSTISSMTSSDSYYSYLGNMKKADGTRKTSFTNTVVFGSYGSVLTFTTVNDGAQVDVVLGNLSAPGSDYRTVPFYLTKTSGSDFSTLTINLNPVIVNSLNRGYIIFFRLTLGTAGTYTINSNSNYWGGISYCEVVGVEGGQSGQGGVGSPLDFVDLETSGTNTIVNSTGYTYSGVGYTISAPAASYRIVFKRVDTINGGTTTVMVTVYCTPSTYVTLISGSTTTNSTISNSSP